MPVPERCGVRRARRAVRRRTRESSRASSSGRRCGGAGSCRPARRSRRRRRRRSPRPPRACSRRRTRPGVRTGPARPASSRSWLQAIVARSVRCRSGAEREPPASRGSRCSSRSSSADGESAFTRAAASSIASGRQSRRRQISATSPFAAKSELTARARCTKSSTASRSRNGSTATSHSPSTCSGSRLVTSTVRCGQEPIVSATAGGRVEQMLEVVEHEQQALVADRCRQRVLRPERLGSRPSRRARDRRARRAAPTTRHGRSRRRPRRRPAARAASCRFRPGRSASPAGRRAAAAAPRSGRSPARGRGTASPEPAGSSRAASSAAGSPPSRAGRGARARSGPSAGAGRGRAHRRRRGRRSPATGAPARRARRPRSAPPGARRTRRSPRRPRAARPVCRPIRTRTGPPASARCASAAAATASDARANATKNASPCVSTSTPSCRRQTSRKHAVVLGEHVRVPVAQLLEQPRRPLDVGEEERHRPGRKLGLHTAILSRLGDARDLWETLSRASLPARRSRAGGGVGRRRDAPSRCGWSSGPVRVVGLGLVHDQGERVGLPALRDAEMAGQRPDEHPRELPVRPIALDGHGQRLLAADARRPDAGHHWNVKAAAQGRFQFVVRASDRKLLIGQANAQLRVPNGITGTQQVTIGGVPQTPGPVGLEAFETQLPPIVAARTSRRVSGSTTPTLVHGSYGAVSAGRGDRDEAVRLEVRQGGVTHTDGYDARARVRSAACFERLQKRGPPSGGCGRWRS